MQTLSSRVSAKQSFFIFFLNSILHFYCVENYRRQWQMPAIYLHLPGLLFNMTLGQKSFIVALLMFMAFTLTFTLTFTETSRVVSTRIAGVGEWLVESGWKSNGNLFISAAEYLLWRLEYKLEHCKRCHYVCMRL